MEYVSVTVEKQSLLHISTGHSSYCPLAVRMNSENAGLNTKIDFRRTPESVLNTYAFTQWHTTGQLPLDPIGNQREEIQSRWISPWCTSVGKRVFDLTCVTPALMLIAPILGMVAIGIRLTSPGPIIFRQQRAGKDRKPFIIYKFRTMLHNSETMGPGHTAKGDPRITPIGNFLRRFKLDELPQLYNVLRGDMSLVGPRPKLPHHEHTLMACRPGVTGAATLAFRDEQHILCEVPAERLEAFYKENVVPLKIKLDTDYMQRATLASDISVLFATVLRSGRHLTHQDLVACTDRSSIVLNSRPHLATEVAGD